jgi:hypothetical protein
MNDPSIGFHKIWIEQCAAMEGIRFVRAAERDPDFAAELPAFIAEIRRLFTAEEIHAYLDRLERTKFLAPKEPDWEIDDLQDEAEEEPWPDNPVLGAEELLRFSRVRQLLQE